MLVRESEARLYRIPHYMQSFCGSPPKVASGIHIPFISYFCHPDSPRREIKKLDHCTMNFMTRLESNVYHFYSLLLATIQSCGPNVIRPPNVVFSCAWRKDEWHEIW